MIYAHFPPFTKEEIFTDPKPSEDHISDLEFLDPNNPPPTYNSFRDWHNSLTSAEIMNILYAVWTGVRMHTDPFTLPFEESKK